MEKTKKSKKSKRKQKISKLLTHSNSEEDYKVLVQSESRQNSSRSTPEGFKSLPFDSNPAPHSIIRTPIDITINICDTDIDSSHREDLDKLIDFQEEVDELDGKSHKAETNLEHCRNLFHSCTISEATSIGIDSRAKNKKKKKKKKKKVTYKDDQSLASGGELNTEAENNKNRSKQQRKQKKGLRKKKSHAKRIAKTTGRKLWKGLRISCKFLWSGLLLYAKPFGGMDLNPAKAWEERRAYEKQRQAAKTN